MNPLKNSKEKMEQVSFCTQVDYLLLQNEAAYAENTDLY
jgi:hypothetical protein